MTKKLYSTSEASQILNVSRVEVFRRIKSGRLRAEKIGRNYVIAHDVLTEAIGKALGPSRKKDIENSIDKAIKEYGEVFKRLGKE